MTTGVAFSLVLAVAVVGRAGGVPSPRRDQFDLEDLMNKFLSEYDTKTTEPQHQHVPQQDGIAFEGDQPNYFPDPIEEQSYYSEPQEYYQEPQEHPSFYPEPHHHQMEHQHQHKHHQSKQQQQYQQGGEMSGYNRYKDSPATEHQNSPPPAAQTAEQRQPAEAAGEDSQQPQQDNIDPKLRDFTLIISKLLFQLSQL